ncbi:hypothetical protein OHX09_09470 [Acinetobacter baumannii]|nr:hypothetical protein [Acinetobacter baumannii]MDC5578333.1 hypothetical protein [Acinetobacter baumannii]
MKRKKFSKKRFYRRLEAQGIVKGGYVNWNGELEGWQLPYCNFPDLAKAAGKAAEKFQEVVESIKKIDFQPPNIKPIKTKTFIDGVDLGAGKDFSVTYSRT